MDPLFVVVELVLIVCALGSYLSACWQAGRFRRRRPVAVDPREWLREYRRKEFAEWDAEFRRLGGVPDYTGEPIVGFEALQLEARAGGYIGPIDGVPGPKCMAALRNLGYQTETIRDWGGRVVREVIVNDGYNHWRV